MKCINKLIAKIIYKLGVLPDNSTGIAGEITSGYDKLSPEGYWQYPLKSVKFRARWPEEKKA